jgi:hypothetical protein
MQYWKKILREEILITISMISYKKYLGSGYIKKANKKKKVLVPTSEIAKLHGVDTNIINKSFRRHKDEFVKGDDYFAFNQRQLIATFGSKHAKELIKQLFTNNSQKVVYLFTYKGYFNFVKTINSKHAWKMFHKMKEIVFHVIETSEEELNRRVNKELRKNLTEVLEDSGENGRMHNHGHSTYTLMVYDFLGIKKEYKEFHKESPKGNFRDTLDEDTAKRIGIVEDLVKSLVKAGMQYNGIKEQLGSIFAKSNGLLT